MGAFENIKSIEKNSVFTTRGMMKNNDFCLWWQNKNSVFSRKRENKGRYRSWKLWDFRLKIKKGIWVKNGLLKKGVSGPFFFDTGGPMKMAVSDWDFDFGEKWVFC